MSSLIIEHFLNIWFCCFNNISSK